MAPTSLGQAPARRARSDPPPSRCSRAPRRAPSAARACRPWSSSTEIRSLSPIWWGESALEKVTGRSSPSTGTTVPGSRPMVTQSAMRMSAVPLHVQQQVQPEGASVEEIDLAGDLVVVPGRRVSASRPTASSVIKRFPRPMIKVRELLERAVLVSTEHAPCGPVALGEVRHPHGVDVADEERRENPHGEVVPQANPTVAERPRTPSEERVGEAVRVVLAEQGETR